MIEIRFRAINKKGHWRYGFVVFQLDEWLICDTVDIPPCTSDPGGDTRFYKDIIDPSTISQFTGLKDKNGIDIYEGSIVKCIHTEGLSWPKIHTDIGIVEFSIASFSLKCINEQTRNAKDISKRYFFIHFTPKREFEVIGNIYENAELLQQL